MNRIKTKKKKRQESKVLKFCSRIHAANVSIENIILNAVARLPPLSLPCWRTRRHVFRDWTRAKTVATSGIYQHRRGLSDFFARLVYNFRHQYTSNFLELEDDLASPCISRLPTGKSRVVKYTNDDDARFRREIHDWSVNWRISQLHSTAFSLPIKREAEKLTSFENERSGRTR